MYDELYRKLAKIKDVSILWAGGEIKSDSRPENMGFAVPHRKGDLSIF
jgi:hypothetical protein